VTELNCFNFERGYAFGPASHSVPHLAIDKPFSRGILALNTFAKRRKRTREPQAFPIMGRGGNDGERRLREIGSSSG
jgi:hypothetical protein